MLPDLIAANRALTTVVLPNTEDRIARAKPLLLEVVHHLRCVEEADGDGEVLAERTHAKCRQLCEEATVMFGNENVDVPLLWDMSLQVFDTVLSEMQATAGQSRSA